MSQLIRKVQTVLPLAASIFRTSPLSPCSVWGGTIINHRQYKGRPTHGIGKWRHFFLKRAPRQKKSRMRPLVYATDTTYAILNVKMSGYDMTLVEHYSQYIHNLCKRLGIDGYSHALPTKSTEIFLMQDQGTKMSSDAVLKTHERVVQVTRLSTSLCSVFLDILLKNQPEGVDLSVSEHTEADYRARFKTRPEMESLIAQIGK